LHKNDSTIQGAAMDEQQPRPMQLPGVLALVGGVAGAAAPFLPMVRGSRWDFDADFDLSWFTQIDFLTRLPGPVPLLWMWVFAWMFPAVVALYAALRMGTGIRASCVRFVWPEWALLGVALLAWVSLSYYGATEGFLTRRLTRHDEFLGKPFFMLYVLLFAWTLLSLFELRRPADHAKRFYRVLKMAAVCSASWYGYWIAFLFLYNDPYQLFSTVGPGLFVGVAGHGLIVLAASMASNRAPLQVSEDSLAETQPEAQAVIPPG
jgi:hypothetical protein